MARLFVSSSTQYLTYPDDIARIAPVSVMAWFRLSAAASGANTIWSQSFTTNEYYVMGRLQANPTADTVQHSTRDVGWAHSIYSSAGLTDGVWYHIGGYDVAAGNDRTVYFNGSPGTPSTSSGQTPGQVNTTSIGSWPNGDTGTPDLMDGDVAEVAVWGTKLTAAEFALGGAGLHPLFIRPQSLLAYWPLWGVYNPEINALSGAFNLNLVNSPTFVEDHPPLFYPPPGKYPTHPSLYYTSPRPSYQRM